MVDSSGVVARIFENELRQRGVRFRRDHESGRYVIKRHGTEVLVSLDNLAREYNRDLDESRISKFVETVLSPPFDLLPWPEARKSILFCLEPTDYVERPTLRMPISQHVDRVPVHFDASTGRIAWISQAMLQDWRVSQEEMEETASENLVKMLADAHVQHEDIDGVRLGYFLSALPFKSVLVLATNLKRVVLPELGWPLFAVMPNRDFLYLWSTQHTDFAGRVGRVVIDEFKKSPYPISTEVFEISDTGIKAIGSFADDS